MTKIRPLLLGALILTAACSSVPKKAANVVVDRWPEPSVAAARKMMNQYGIPDDVTPGKLVWRDKGPWRRIVVWNRPQVYRGPRDFDLVLQTVKYPVTREQAAELVAFSSALVVDVGSGELSSRGTREAVNFLNLNLADEVARGTKSVEEAQVAYRRILDFTAAGKTSKYTSGLLFHAPPIAGERGIISR